MKECTFSPSINKSYVRRRNSEISGNLNIHEKLYSQYEEKRKIIEQKSYKKARESELEELDECTFSPKINNRKP